MAFRSIVFRKSVASLRSGLSPAVTPISSRSLATFSLPDLPYDYSALEPSISGEIMQLHRQTYVTNYNKTLEQLEEATNKGDAPAVVKLQIAFKFNGGGRF